MSPTVIGLLGIDLKEVLRDLSPYAELVLLAVVFAETGLLIGFFLPGDSLLIVAGVMAGQHTLKIGLTLPACFIGAFLGSEIGYVIGQRLGPRLFTKQESRLFKQEYVERTRVFFERHGPRTVVMSRFVPIVRTFTPVLAGVAEMKRRTYSVYNLIGAVIWAVGLVLIGYAVGDSLGNVDDVTLLPIVGVVILISFIPVFIEWRRTRKDPDKPKSLPEAEAEAAALEEIANPDD